MTDGTALVQNNENLWYRLTPDSKGSYVNGTWSGPLSMGTTYGPLYFASAVLSDDRAIVEGGEYNFFKNSESNQGAILDPVAGTWTSVTQQQHWQLIGSAESAVLSSGTFMLAVGASDWLYDEASSTWTQTGQGSSNVGPDWTLLPNGEVLTPDVADAPNSQIYNPATGSWSSAGSIPVTLARSGAIGPAILRPDGTVFKSPARRARRRSTTRKPLRGAQAPPSLPPAAYSSSTRKDRRRWSRTAASCCPRAPAPPLLRCISLNSTASGSSAHRPRRTRRAT